MFKIHRLSKASFLLFVFLYKYTLQVCVQTACIWYRVYWCFHATIRIKQDNLSTTLAWDWAPLLLALGEARGAFNQCKEHLQSSWVFEGPILIMSGLCMQVQGVQSIGKTQEDPRKGLGEVQHPRMCRLRTTGEGWAGDQDTTKFLHNHCSERKSEWV